TVSVHRIPSFAHADDMEMALDMGRVHLHQRIKVPYEAVNADGEVQLSWTITTPGRMLLWSVMPRHAELGFDLVSAVQTKKVITSMVGKVYRHAGQKATVIFSDKLMELGFRWACRSGISFGIEDLVVPAEKAGLVEEARAKVQEFETEHMNGLISATERYNKVLDVWTACQNKVAKAMNKTIRQETGSQPNSIYMMAHSGARSSEAQIRQLAGMRGLMAKPSGEIIETPVLSSFKEGLGVLEYFNSTHGARKGLADTALKTANSGYLTRRLVDVAQDCVVLEQDCGTLRSVEMRPVIQGSELIESLAERVLGRVLAEDAVDIRTDKVVLEVGVMVDEEAAEKLNGTRVDTVRVRSPLMCEAEVGVCAKCYGRDMARGTMVSMGEAVGVVAAQSIGEPGTQLTMRTFHIGGAATRAGEDSSITSTVDGVAEVENRNVMSDSRGQLIVMTRSSELVLRNDDGQEVGRYRIPYGARLHFDSGDRVKQGQAVAEWDPHSKPIISEQEGFVNYVDLVDRISVQEVIDASTGIARQEVIDWRQSAGGADLRPRLTLRDAGGEVVKLKNGMEARYYVQPGFILSANNGDAIKVGDVLAREPRESSKTSDITGGLPRVVELFEARRPKDAAVIADRDGIIRYDKDFKSRRRILIKDESDPMHFSEYMISKNEALLVNEGDVVRKGDMLVEGHLVPHDILAVMGVEALLHHLQREIQAVYRLQGVKISEKHIEIIIRQMLRKVEVVDPGDSMLLVEEHLDSADARKLNKGLEAEGKTPVTFRPILHGITKASVQTKSFISAASFQETTRVLTEAAVSCKEDTLEGLKENVIVGRLIPAGTGNVLRKLQSVARKRDHVIDVEREAKRQARLEAEETAATLTQEHAPRDFPEIDLPEEQCARK
ncbi:MAG: DNA-directed RNA polymerase subunit beta', partial [Alphaproteobacteria bacterium]|nr:DNA-directed RNA polymerase subunit beta' [Alphaproteobacteria bacterium]